MMSRDADYPRYVISVAADLAGIHPQTLRAYERVGLVVPARTAGGGRRYSDADLVRVARIAELTRLGLPHVGIKLVLDLEDELRGLRIALGASPSTRSSPSSAVSSSVTSAVSTSAVSTSAVSTSASSATTSSFHSRRATTTRISRRITP